jgi:hypothetical protein
MRLRRASCGDVASGIPDREPASPPRLTGEPEDGRLTCRGARASRWNLTQRTVVPVSKFIVSADCGSPRRISGAHVTLLTAGTGVGSA